MDSGPKGQKVEEIYTLDEAIKMYSPGMDIVTFFDICNKTKFVYDDFM